MLAQAGDKNHGEECCGNGLCDGLETSASCPADCVGDVETLTQTVYGSAVNAWLRSWLSVLPASCCHLSSIVSSASVSTVVHPSLVHLSLVHLSLVHLSLVHLSLVDLICPAICPCMQSPYLQVTVLRLTQHGKVLLDARPGYGRAQAPQVLPRLALSLEGWLDYSTVQLGQEKSASRSRSQRVWQ